MDTMNILSAACALDKVVAAGPGTLDVSSLECLDLRQLESAMAGVKNLIDVLTKLSDTASPGV